ncbi:hypothetical protein [Kribbella sp. VKM Ac-2566]|uniref:hypothetical protein n=1 Tax=Kribbella sp. VKM Ac-2566 TaxID=2512218 RepID=UPI00106245CE|nr:hypothetical protein [Kribbella sp. VKM Ac-2566]TDW97868.1 hypothetical protein EV647_2560 [Kribbella sp. VKM Ac-2566]
MPAHVFVDESKTKGLLMAATMCPAVDVNAYRRTMASLLMPRERRIHFTKESPPRRRKILGVIAEFGLDARLYQADKNDVAARRACLAAMVRDIAGSAERLVIERDESTATLDKQVLFRAARRYDCAESLQYELLAAHADPLLWIPDAVAWSWVKGGEWRDLVAPYSTVIRV